MLTAAKKKKMVMAIKTYHKKYLGKKFTDLDESGTRLMVNTFLTDILGYTSIEEVKTEYMIRGTYADYMIQLNGKRHFLVEVKALSIDLSDKHLRQAVNYGANEGVDWALLTNGHCFEFYRILFNKPIESRLVFSIDLNDIKQLNNQIETLQYLHKDSVSNKGLDQLWNKCQALDAHHVAGLLYSKPVINFLKRELKVRFKNKFHDDEILEAIKEVLCNKIDLEKVKPAKGFRNKKPKKAKELVVETAVVPEGPVIQTTGFQPYNALQGQSVEGLGSK